MNACRRGLMLSAETAVICGGGQDKKKREKENASDEGEGKDNVE